MNHKWLAKIQKKTDIRKRINKKCTFSYFFCPKIWSYQKKAVPLHSLSEMKHPSDLSHNAAIAQLVEHDLAKVGVASSSLVCRSKEESRIVSCFF